MKNTDRTFFEILKKFFKPVFSMKKLSLKWLVPAVWISIIWIIIVFLLKDITNIISEWSKEEIINLLYVFILFIILNYFLMFFTKNWTHVSMWPLYRKYMYKIYLDKYLHLDNNESEKLWTGKLIALIDKWMHSWVDLLVRVYLDIIPWITFILLSFLFIAFVNVYYFIIVFITFIFIYYLTYIFQKRAKNLREKRRDINIWIMARFVKILMSKFEILQNNKLNNELEIINSSLHKNVEYNKKIVNNNFVTDISVKFLLY